MRFSEALWVPSAESDAEGDGVFADLVPVASFVKVGVSVAVGVTAGGTVMVTVTDCEIDFVDDPSEDAVIVTVGEKDNVEPVGFRGTVPVGVTDCVVVSVSVPRLRVLVTAGVAVAVCSRDGVSGERLRVTVTE